MSKQTQINLECTDIIYANRPVNKAINRDVPVKSLYAINDTCIK